MKNRFTGRFGRLFLNAVTLEGRSPGAVVTKQESGEDPGLRHSRMTLCDKRRGGFTLIELLVVVLIIGILTAVALPQYQKAVARTRLAGAISLATSIVQAERVYHMANGEYTVDVDHLDIQLPGEFTRKSLETSTSQYISGQLHLYLYINGVGGHPRVVIRSTQIPSFVNMSFDSEGAYYWCGVLKTDPQVELGKSICSTYGALRLDTAGSGYFYYDLK